MKHIFVPLMAILFLQACGEREASDADRVAAVAVPSEERVGTGKYTGCYLMTIDSDSATMRLEYDGAKYYGELEYRRSGKDVNKGKVRLVEVGPYLKGFYDFNSEGILSIREFILKKVGPSLAEGYGELDVKRDSAFFRFPANLDYEEKHPFVKQNCP